MNVYRFYVLYEKDYTPFYGPHYFPDFEALMQEVGTEENFEELQDWYAMLLAA